MNKQSRKLLWQSQRTPYAKAMKMTLQPPGSCGDDLVDGGLALIRAKLHQFQGVNEHGGSSTQVVNHSSQLAADLPMLGDDFLGFVGFGFFGGEQIQKNIGIEKLISDAHGLQVDQT